MQDIQSDVPPATLGDPNAREDYTVNVVVSEPHDQPGVLFVQVQPEVLRLNGQKDNKITWKLTGPANPTATGAAFFASANDVQFTTDKGVSQFPDTSWSSNEITRIVHSEETDQTIYTYLLTLRFLVNNGPQIAIRIDPEVDNPPPAPR